MWLILGNALCILAKAVRYPRLYTASRHSFRSGRPELFPTYWRYFGQVKAS
jgi:hypothetical protein